jgi:O-methyltransferase
MGGFFSMKGHLKNAVIRFVRLCGYDIVKYNQDEFPRDFTQDDIAIIRSVKPYTMTSYERIYALIQAAKYVIRNNIPGDIVECGVWRGGSMMAIAKVLLNQKSFSRSLYLFDTFAGMTKPGDKDVSYTGEKASEEFEKLRLGDDSSEWCYASLDEVKKAVYSVGYDKTKIHFVEGRVEDTIPDKAPENISLLRLDTDWYESTGHELVHLFPRLSQGGVLIIDDYGYWQGARQAVDEYISQNKLKLLLNRIDRTGRIAVKP